MSEPDDPLRRAAALGPPTTTDAIVLHIFGALVARHPKLLDEVLDRARDHQGAANVIALHGATGNAEWEAAFRNAEVRLESVAAMLRVEDPPKPKKRKKKR